MANPAKPPSFADMMWPTLQALKDTGGSASNEELLSRVVQIVGIPEAIQKIPYRHGTLLEDRLHWARTYLRKVGAIESSERGIWSITGNGRALTESEVKGIPLYGQVVVSIKLRGIAPKCASRSNSVRQCRPEAIAVSQISQ
jgi:restriction endonuclease Mrr